MNFIHTEKYEISEEDEEINVLYLLNEYCDSNPEFNSKFIDSIDRVLNSHGKISGNQFNTLVDIYNKLKILKENKDA